MSYRVIYTAQLNETDARRIVSICRKAEKVNSYLSPVETYADLYENDRVECLVPETDDALVAAILKYPGFGVSLAAMLALSDFTGGEGDPTPENYLPYHHTTEICPFAQHCMLRYADDDRDDEHSEVRQAEENMRKILPNLQQH